MMPNNATGSAPSPPVGPNGTNPARVPPVAASLGEGLTMLRALAASGDGPAVIVVNPRCQSECEMRVLTYGPVHGAPRSVELHCCFTAKTAAMNDDEMVVCRVDLDQLQGGLANTAKLAGSAFHLAYDAAHRQFEVLDPKPGFNFSCDATLLRAVERCTLTSFFGQVVACDPVVDGNRFLVEAEAALFHARFVFSTAVRHEPGSWVHYFAAKSVAAHGSDENSPAARRGPRAEDIGRVDALTHVSPKELDVLLAAAAGMRTACFTGDAVNHLVDLVELVRSLAELRLRGLARPIDRDGIAADARASHSRDEREARERPRSATLTVAAQLLADNAGAMPTTSLVTRIKFGTFLVTDSERCRLPLPTSAYLTQSAASPSQGDTYHHLHKHCETGTGTMATYVFGRHGWQQQGATFVFESPAAMNFFLQLAYLNGGTWWRRHGGSPSPDSHSSPPRTHVSPASLQQLSSDHEVSRAAPSAEEALVKLNSQYAALQAAYATAKQGLAHAQSELIAARGEQEAAQAKAEELNRQLAASGEDSSPPRTHVSAATCTSRDLDVG